MKIQQWSEYNIENECSYKVVKKVLCNDIVIVKEAYWISSNSSVIQYCDSNIGLFSIAPHLVIALPTLRQQ